MSTSDRRLLPVIAPVARRVIANARAIGCTCPEPKVRWDPEARVPVVLHEPPCPRAPKATDEDRQYWRRLRREWTQAEYAGRDADAWRAALTAPRPGREHLMDDDERELVAQMPDRVRVFRGAVRGVNEAGLSWCLARGEAVGWAHRNVGLRGDGEPVVVVGALARQAIIAFTMHRTEAEVLALPETVTVVRVEPAGPDNRAAEAARTLRAGEDHIEVQSADD